MQLDDRRLVADARRPAGRSSGGRAFGIALRAAEVVAWAAFFSFTLAVISLRYVILPRIEEFRPQIVDSMTRAIGLPVEIGRLSAGWEGLYPRIDVADLRIRDRDGKEVLLLPGVESIASWSSLLHGELRLRTLVIDRPQLAIRRDPQGTLHVAGLRLSGEASNAGFSDWLLAQHEIVIRDAEITWQDDVRGAPVLALTAVNFRLRNEDEHHAIGVSARPPAEFGAAFDLRAELTGRSINELAAWNGRAYAELGETNLAIWRRWVDYPLDLREGRGAIRVWVNLDHGRIRRATADLRLDGVLAQLGAELPVLPLATLRGRLRGGESDGGFDLAGQQFAMAMKDGPSLAPTDFRIFQPHRTADSVRPSTERGRFTASLVELDPILKLGEFLPIPLEMRQALAELQPRGRVLDVDVSWKGPAEDRRDLEFRARFADLGMRAWNRIPGFVGLSGRIEGRPEKGQLRLESKRSEIDLPAVFPESRVVLDRLDGRIDWSERVDTTKGDPNASLQMLVISLRDVSLANADFSGTADGEYRTVERGPGVVDLNVRLDRADGRRVGRYLPLASIMGEETRGYLEAAIRAGRSTEARLKLKGDLRDFPFVDPAKGQFQVSARIAGGEFEIARGWPKIESIDGELLFERAQMKISARSAAIYGTRLAGVTAEISDMRHEPVLVVNGSAEGPTAEFLKFVAQSPVSRMIGGATDSMDASGRGRLRLRLDLPLENLPKSRVAGEFQLANNTVTVDSRLPPIVGATGRVAFSESNLTISEVRGQLLGGTALISGGTRSQGDVVVTAQGEATVAGMRSLFDHAWRRFLSGAAQYVATVTVREGRTQLAFESNLRGVTSDLPAPLAKTAAEVQPLRVDILPGEAGQRDRISVTVGNTVAAEFLRRKEGDSMVVQRTGISLTPVAGQPVRLPERNGTLVSGSLATLDLDRWLPLFEADPPSTGSPGTPSATAAELRLGTLDIYGRRITDVSLRAGFDGEGWSANLVAAELAGDLGYRGEGGGKFVARLQHFRLPEPYPGAKTGDVLRELPAVDLLAERFAWRGKPLGRVEVVAQRDGGNWRVERIANVTPDSSLTGKGVWRAGQVAQSAFEFGLDVSDIGRFLERLGFGNVVKGGTARLTGRLRWNGDPVSVDYPSLAGDLSLHAANGQFLDVEPGIGKVLSLLKFDLSDVFGKGFGFSRIDGQIDIDRGVATIRDARVRGSSADIFVQGATQLARETQDLRIRVVPSLGDGAASLTGFVWGPIVGVATMLASRLLRNPLGEIFAIEYSVTGSWSDPKAVRIGSSTVNTPDEVPQTAPPRDTPATDSGNGAQPPVRTSERP